MRLRRSRRPMSARAPMAALCSRMRTTRRPIASFITRLTDKDGTMSWLSDWGTSTSSTTTDQKTDPWAPAQPVLKSILSGLGNINPNLTGAETGALGTLQGIANAGNPYAGGIDQYAKSMLAGGGANSYAPMVNSAYDAYTKAMNPTASGDYLDPN